MSRLNTSIEILTGKNGIKPLQQYLHYGNTYVEARNHVPYIIRVHNPTEFRVLAVVSVDGVSVLTGKLASVNDGGYIIPPNSSVDIKGWRLNNHEVAQFVFGSLPEGYASQTGKTGNEGVIGVALVLEEQIPMGIRYPAPGSCGEGMKGVTMGAPQMATGFGDNIASQVRNAAFKRSSIVLSYEVYYDSREGLQQRGIKVLDDKPNPFPADMDIGCQPPMYRIKTS